MMLTRKGSMKIKYEWAQFMECITKGGYGLPYNLNLLNCLGKGCCLVDTTLSKRLGHPIIGFNNEILVYLLSFIRLLHSLLF